MSEEDTTTPEQRAYWHTLHCAIAEAERPTESAVMTEALRDLYKDARRRAKLRRQPYNEWQGIVRDRMTRLLEALCIDVPKVVGKRRTE